MRMRNLSKILILGLILALPCAAFARAWGGHGGSSSPSSSSSSRGSSSSSSFGNFWSSVAGSAVGTSLANSSSSGGIGSGIVIILVIVGIGIAIVVMKSKNWNFQNISSEIEKFWKDRPDLMENTDGGEDLGDISLLTDKDPNFTEQKFKELVNIGFYKIQNAWSACDMSGARAYISDGVMRRFSTQLEWYKRDGRKNILDGLSLDSVQIEGITSDDMFDYITTLVTATAKDYTIDKDGKVVDGDKDEYITWTERWVFMRSASVQTKEAESGVFADKCPNCGASLAINAIGKCDYCGSEMNKGEFDWVLSEIIQID